MRIIDPDRPKIEQYRRKAAEARSIADELTEASVRQNWELISLSYADMADRLERRSRR